MDHAVGAFEAKAQLAATIAALQAFPPIRHLSDADVANFVAEGRL